MKKTLRQKSWLEAPIVPILSKITIEHIVIGILILITLITRLYNVDVRVMSHDEVNHVVPSYDLYVGRGYHHDPVTHGPLQFHLIALSYFLFGDSDFSSRIPAAIFSTLAVAFVLIYYRRYLGKIGALFAGFFFMISPYILFYGRYARNEAFVMLFSVVMLYAVLRYLEEGHKKWLYVLTVSLALHFTAKETAYIYSALLLVFLAILLFIEVLRYPWHSQHQKNHFLTFTLVAILTILGSLIVSIYLTRSAVLNLQPAAPMQSPAFDLNGALMQLVAYLQTYGLDLLPMLVPLILGALLLWFIKEKLAWNKIANLRSFDLLILVGTLVLPLLTDLPSKLTGVEPIDYTNQLGIITTAIYLIYFFVVAAMLGSAWNRKIWWKNAGVFYAIFTILYTTVFTNGFGFFTGVVGSLGYWLAQHGLQRGNQPLYYYAGLQLPFYEFLAIFGTLLAFYLGIKNKKIWFQPNKGSLSAIKPIPVLALLLFWSFSTLAAFSLAGEKMPWLTVHIAIPMLLCAGWAAGFVIESVFKDKDRNRTWIMILLLFLFIIALTNVSIILLGNQPPFQGKTQEQLQRTNNFLFACILAGGISYGVFNLAKECKSEHILQTALLAFLLLLILLTIRTSYHASFINYNYPTEFLVYAHAAPGPKEVLSQVEEISRRTTLGLGIKVAYDNHALYPYWWYFRHYPNKIGFMENPTRSLEDSPVIIAGQANYSKLDPIVRNKYYIFEYMRLWWPMQDYYNLTWDRITYALTNANMRQALFNIWFNRDYALYAQMTNNTNLTLENWLPSEKMRLYIRKDIAAQIWNLGIISSTSPFEEADPYAAKISKVIPAQFISSEGSEPGLLQAPHGIAIAPDDSVYVADSHNHRIQHFSSDGQLIKSWGSYASVQEGSAPGGTFNEPWGVAVGADRSVYVADTWNHRIQKFSADGEFIRMWGAYTLGNTTTGLYGPRGIVIDKNNHVLVTDTGNKRVMVYDTDGNYLAQFGSGGAQIGQLDEPVGIALSSTGDIYVADTWNRRIQVFKPDPAGMIFSPISSWDIEGWYGQSINNKPFLTLDSEDNVLVSDPEGGHILKFNSNGEFLHGWTGFSLSEDIINQPSDLKSDSQGRLWVSDAGSNSLMVFDKAQLAEPMQP